MSNFRLTQAVGVIPAMLTFFDENEKVDDGRIREMTEFMLSKGVGGFYLTGSTGQCFTMDGAERTHVIETVVKTVNGRVPVIAHIGDIGTKKSIELAGQAEAAGADAISSVPPFYWKFSPDAVFNYYKDISESVQIPMVVYNIVLAGTISRDQLLRLASLPNVQGLKYTARDHDELGWLKTQLGSDFMIYSGCDEMAFSGLCFGADGIIGSFYNVIPELYVDLYNAQRRGDLKESMRLMKVADEFIFALLKYDYLGAMYNVMRWRGLDAGCPRRPFATYTDDQLKDLKAELRGIRERNEAHELDCFNLD